MIPAAAIEIRMPTTSARAVYRVALFRRLETADSGQAELDQIFGLLGQGRQAAERAQLAELATQFEEGQAALLEALRNTGHFFDWELDVMRVALAAGDVRAAYRYLGEHYKRLAAFQRRLRSDLWLPATVYAFVCIGIPVLAVLEGLVAPSVALALALLPLLMAAGLGWAAVASARHWQAGRLRRSWIDLCYRLPGVGRLLALQQSLHYFTNLSLCTGAGLPLGRSLQLSAAALPYSPRRAAFEKLRDDIAKGGRLSDALRQSGALTGVLMRGVRAEGVAGAALAQKVLTESTRQTVEENMNRCARWLPQILLLILPLVLLGNLLAMSC